MTVCHLGMVFDNENFVPKLFLKKVKIILEILKYLCYNIV